MGRRATVHATEDEHDDIRCPVCYHEAVHWELEGQFGIECVECGYSRAFPQPPATSP